MAQLPSTACPSPSGGSLGRGILEAPEEFFLPGIRAEQRGHFIQARNTYRRALTDYLSDLVVSRHPDVRHRFTTLGSLWDLGLPRYPGRLPSAWDDFD
ncbi:MAG: hypothetical protein FJW09_09640 [Actinobacteria bacterium]|nr:hypothetical protein [Actinomycetota bacterium]